MIRMSGKRPKLAAAEYDAIEAKVRARRQMPTVRQIAREHGISTHLAAAIGNGYRPKQIVRGGR